MAGTLRYLGTAASRGSRVPSACPRVFGAASLEGCAHALPAGQLLDHPLLALLARGARVCSGKSGTREVRGTSAALPGRESPGGRRPPAVSPPPPPPSLRAGGAELSTLPDRALAGRGGKGQGGENPSPPGL